MDEGGLRPTRFCTLRAGSPAVDHAFHPDVRVDSSSTGNVLHHIVGPFAPAFWPPPTFPPGESFHVARCTFAPSAASSPCSRSRRSRSSFPPRFRPRRTSRSTSRQLGPVEQVHDAGAPARHLQHHADAAVDRQDRLDVVQLAEPRGRRRSTWSIRRRRPSGRCSTT